METSQAPQATAPDPIAAAVRSLADLNLQPGEHYAGVVLNADGTHSHHLVLLLAAPDKRLTWKQATAWAEKVGGSLPTRQEQSLLFANCKQHFERAWHWSLEEYDASFAWLCDFGFGDQFDGRKSFEGCARAVRRV